MTHRCDRCGTDNQFVNHRGCDPQNLPTGPIPPWQALLEAVCDAFTLETCWACNGTGLIGDSHGVVEDNPCPHCIGEGKLIAETDGMTVALYERIRDLLTATKQRKEAP